MHARCKFGANEVMDSLEQVGSRVTLPLGKVGCCAHLSGSLFGGALGTSIGPAGVGG